MIKIVNTSSMAGRQRWISYGAIRAHPLVIDKVGENVLGLQIGDHVALRFILGSEKSYDPNPDSVEKYQSLYKLYKNVYGKTKVLN